MDLEYIVNHVIFPPQPPQKDDWSIGKEFGLVQEVGVALRSFLDHIPERHHERVLTCIKMVESLLYVRDIHGTFSAARLKARIKMMKENDCIALQIKSQNAGLILRKLADNFTFEAFELSPTQAAVMETKGRLHRCFPGPCIAVDKSRIDDPAFLEAIATLFEQLDAKTPTEAYQKVSKAGSKVIETRDTVDPMFITEMFMGLLRGLGKPWEAHRFWKHTRDDVLWDNCLAPWRRSPLWLLLRVTLQSTLHKSEDDAQPNWVYKSFMAFLSSHVLQKAVKNSMASETIFIIAAKLSRQIVKLKANSETSWMKEVTSRAQHASKLLHQRWSTLQAAPESVALHPWSLAESGFLRDCFLDLPTLSRYLKDIVARPMLAPATRICIAPCHPRIKQSSSVLPQIYQLSKKKEDAPEFLIDLEQWVADHLFSWVELHMATQTAVSSLGEVIHFYAKEANALYKGQPESLSIMFLTVMELWVGVDKCAIHHHSILEDYRPVFMVSLFQPLLLPKKSQMERLQKVEQYLQLRKERGNFEGRLVFQDAHNISSLGVRYFDTSTSHQNLRKVIETSAQSCRDERIAQLAAKRARLESLVAQASPLACEYTIHEGRDGRRRSRHRGNCRKCGLKEEAKSMIIEVHEWPLPQSDLEAKSAVFELDLPLVLAKWRDTTYSILVDILSPNLKISHNNQKQYHLLQYDGLKNFRKSTPKRLQLVSQSKPFVAAHYKHQKVEQATEHTICVNNGLQYRLYDSVERCLTGILLGRANIQKKCTLQLPDGAFAKLQFALDSTAHSSNEVISKQNICPSSMSLHEFYSFSTLRSGHLLQWRNIARELVSPVLNFKIEAVELLVRQAIWQAGPAGSSAVCRDSHIDLEEEAFGLSLLSSLDVALTHVEENWQGITAVSSFVCIASRLLSISESAIVHSGCYAFLRRAREVTLLWSRSLGQMYQDTLTEEDLLELNNRSLMIALVCYSTFDSDSEYVDALLNSDEDIAAFLESTISVYDRNPSIKAGKSGIVQSLLRRHRRTAHFLESKVRKNVLTNRTGIDVALSRLWSGYRPGSEWTALESPNERWLTTKTAAGDEETEQTVHYDILSGKLLVDGSPLTRLPHAYEAHENYRRLFGQKILDVVPSKMKGMSFTARSDICGQTKIHFGLFREDLVIRTSANEEVLELLPLKALREEFPHAFIHNYFHWFNTKRKLVEWRSKPWQSSPSNWWLHSSNSGSCLQDGTSMLVGVQSKSTENVSTVLQSFEVAKNIHITLDIASGQVNVRLPRYKLDFQLANNDAQLESKQYRGMVVDSDQSFGTFTGLQNKLVLKKRDGSSRIVLVPRGPISFKKSTHHVMVSIGTTLGTYVDHCKFTIDMQLGKLKDDGTLSSRLYRIYLHALTSHCLVDYLTGRTDTEEALDALRAAATKSFLSLNAEEIRLLRQIATLTPTRTYYPKHLKVMQQIRWSQLSCLSQHASFQQEAALVLDHARLLKMFGEMCEVIPEVENKELRFLQERAALRESTFCVEGFGAERWSQRFDSTYPARDVKDNRLREARIHDIARLVDNWSMELHCATDILTSMESWRKDIHGAGTDITLGFSNKWLAPLEDFLPQSWCTLHAVLSGTSVEMDRYKVMVLLATVCYSQHCNTRIVQTLLAFATVPELKILRPPTYDLVELAKGYQPERDTIEAVAREHLRPIQDCPESLLPAIEDETEDDATERRAVQYDVACEKSVEDVVIEVMSQWPTANISLPAENDSAVYISHDAFSRDVGGLFSSWYQNLEFRNYTQQVQSILNQLQPRTHEIEPYSFKLPPAIKVKASTQVLFTDLTANPAPPIRPWNSTTLNILLNQRATKSTDCTLVERLLKSVYSTCVTKFERKYVSDLVESLSAHNEETSMMLELSTVDLTQILETYLQETKSYLKSTYEELCEHLTRGTNTLLRNTQMVPRLSTVALLSQLAAKRQVHLSEDWKKAIVQYALSIIRFQHAIRLLNTVSTTEDLVSELSNVGHHSLNGTQYPEWLIFEIENNLIIRQEQIEIAKKMISPSSGSNTIMQLNMGLGKSSVVAPIVAAALADGTKLVRVVVLKSLSKQMFHSLADKLGNLINRRVYFMPISRSLEFSVDQARVVRRMFEDCMTDGGVLLLQPEHLLSFQLMGYDRLLAQDQTGRVIIETQRWLWRNARDILDESDEILSSKFELIYTMGKQRAIELSPHRWIMIQHILQLIRNEAVKSANFHPDGLEVINQDGRYPRLRIIGDGAGDAILATVARQICTKGLPGVPLRNYPATIRNMVYRFMTDASLDMKSLEPLQSLMGEANTISNSLLLLRGLFANGVLKFALQRKRWRVNYGLDLSRTMLAVPYSAKDIPSARAEFSHPEVTIILTCLSYYYGGLSDEELTVSFHNLLLQDNCEEIYQQWVQDAHNLRAAFYQIQGVNLLNHAECREHVFRPLKFSKAAIDFYLSQIVFPKQMKEFPHKLSTSGWDIARTKSHPITGFSGTNDSRYVLPLSVEQGDLLQQLPTNALMLDRLLREENSFQNSAADVLNAHHLLQMATKLNPPARVILDAGAQVLELGNQEVVRAWLRLVPETEALAAIFFDTSSDLCVLTRDGLSKKLAKSTFVNQLDQCLVYLDEAHTRGTDLQLPKEYRALVTLGPGLTKDGIAQACMRMRKLGHGQSVVFCAPMETKRKILEVAGKDYNDAIEVLDVLHWTISETFEQTRRSVPLWAIQGLRFGKHSKIELDASTGNGSSILALAEALQEKEAKTLDERYGVGPTGLREQISKEHGPLHASAAHTRSVQAILDKCDSFDIQSFNSATMQEEQERELSPENERQVQVYHPPASTPCLNILFPDVKHLVDTGELVSQSKAFEPAFSSFSQTTAAKDFDASAWPKNIFVTADFSATVKSKDKKGLDFFVNPVQWLLSFKHDGVTKILIISPWEAQELMPSIRAKGHVTLHVYSPRLTKSMRKLDDLRFCALPPVSEEWSPPASMLELNLFAGQTYLWDYQEYAKLCQFLGISIDPLDEGMEVASDGFLSQASRSKMRGENGDICPFRKSPIAFVKAIFAIRRKGLDYSQSHVGKILAGDLVTEDDF